MGRWWHAIRVGPLDGAWMRWHRQPKRHFCQTQSDPAHTAEGEDEVAADAQLGYALRQGLRPGSTAVVSNYTGPIVPPHLSSSSCWPADEHRIKAPLDYERGPEKTWVYGVLRLRDGKVLTRCTASRNSNGLNRLALRH